MSRHGINSWRSNIQGEIQMSFFVLKHTAVSGPDGDTGYFADALNNSSKRFSNLSSTDLGEWFWENFELVSGEYEAAGSIKFRGKYIDDNGSLVVYQVWESEAVRREWETEVNLSLYTSNQSFTWDTAEESTVELADVQSEIQTLIQSNNYVIRFCADELQVSGMIIGDIMLNQPLTEVV